METAMASKVQAQEYTLHQATAYLVVVAKASLV
jgi:hypothetical protein